MDLLRKKSGVVAALLLVAFTLLLLHMAKIDALTFDERAHIPAAYSYVKYGDIRLNPEHPPILKDLAGIPLLFLDLEFPLASKEWQNGPNEQWRVGTKFLHCTHPEEACNDPRVITFWSRLPLVLVTVLLASFLFWWTRKLAGPIAGLLALTLMIFDPNVIAHGHYVTTDIGIAAFLFFAFYFFIKFLKHPTWKNTILLAIFFTLVQLVKFSAILLLPVFGLFLLLYAACKPINSDKQLLGKKLLRLKIFSEYLGKALFIFIFFLISVWIVYYFHTLGTPSSHLNDTATLMFPEKQLGPLARSIVYATSEGTFIKPYGAYLLGLLMVFTRVAGGNTFYYLGSVQKEAEMSYFPIIFLTKETLPFLTLFVLTLFYSLMRIGRQLAKQHLHQESYTTALRSLFLQHLDTTLIVFFILFYSLLSIFGNLNIGFRHLFPIVPFLYLLIAKGSLSLLRDKTISPAHRKSFGYLFGILIGWQVIIGVTSYPYYLSYYNELAGGTDQGYLIATDSNYDWGQDMLRLQKFVAYHNICTAIKDSSTFSCEAYAPYLPPITTIRTDYFGGEDAGKILGDTYKAWWAEKEPEAGWYALSINTLQENWTKSALSADGQKNTYLWLREYTPVTKAGTSILIYYIP